MQETLGVTVLMVVLIFLVGILLIWLYAAIRPRYGAGPGTAVLAGVAAALLLRIPPDIGWGRRALLFPPGFAGGQMSLYHIWI